ncbi:transposase family protein [Streptomyces hydrogenans]
MGSQGPGSRRSYRPRRCRGGTEPSRVRPGGRHHRRVRPGRRPRTGILGQGRTARSEHPGRHRPNGRADLVLTRTVDITAARTQRIVTFCERLRIPVLADKAYVGAGGTFQVPFKRHLGRPLITRQAAVNRAHARLRFPAERAFTRLSAWRIFRKARISPNRLTSITKAILTLKRRR